MVFFLFFSPEYGALDPLPENRGLFYREKAESIEEMKYLSSDMPTLSGVAAAEQTFLCLTVKVHFKSR